MRLSCGALILLAAATSASAAAGKRARVASATEIRKQQLHHAKSTNPEVEEAIRFEEKHSAVAEQTYTSQGTQRRHMQQTRAAGEGVRGHRGGEWGGPWNEQESTLTFEPFRVMFNTELIFPCTAVDRWATADVATCLEDMTYDAEVDGWEAACVALGTGATCQYNPTPDGDRACVSDPATRPVRTETLANPA
jgi:hypothetical protein